MNYYDDDEISKAEEDAYFRELGTKERLQEEEEERQRIERKRKYQEEQRQAQNNEKLRKIEEQNEIHLENANEKAIQKKLQQCYKSIIPKVKELDSKRKETRKKLNSSGPHFIVQSRNKFIAISIALLIVMIVVIVVAKNKVATIAVSTLFGISGFLSIVVIIVSTAKENNRKITEISYAKEISDISKEIENMKFHCDHVNY